MRKGGVRTGRTPGGRDSAALGPCQGQRPEFIALLCLCHSEQVTEPSELVLLSLKCGDNITLQCWLHSHLELGTTIIFIFYNKELVFWNLPGVIHLVKSTVRLEPRWSGSKAHTFWVISHDSEISEKCIWTKSQSCPCRLPAH